MVFALGLLNLKAQTVCDPSGNLAIVANYDGGEITIDLNANVPNLKIGIFSCKALTVNIIGTY